MNRLFQYLILTSILFSVSVVTSNAVDVSAYQDFLTQNENLTADGLLAQYPAGQFAANADPIDPESATFWQEINAEYNLTPDERLLLQKHGFVVTERLTSTSFGRAYLDIYHQDLPVFVSTDSILHALHMSYDEILVSTEEAYFIPKVTELLRKLHDEVPKLAEKYADTPQLVPMLRDLDLYLAVTLKLLNKPVSLVYPENQASVNQLLDAISSQQALDYPLFAETLRTLDFSQFTPRGHYTRTPELTAYFQAMIWLGRTEVYLTKPKGAIPEPTDADIQRQTIGAILLLEAAEASGVIPLLEEIDETLRFLIGESDNVTLNNLREVRDEIDIKDARELLDVAVWKDFQATLLAKPFSSQRILSQILFSSGASAGQIEPASAFLLLGQRFVIDSFITANVVFDRIKGGVRRMLPSTLDVLFALGNDAAPQLLEDELRQFNYAPNLASLRYLIDDYAEETWDETLYSGWLNSIRMLNPPDDRSIFPSFMRTAAWWQQKMNTQLAAWAQLRHDNLLYVKQSYTGGIVCSYPKSLVEPIPEFYDAVSRFANNAAQRFRGVRFENAHLKDRIVTYFEEMSGICDALADIARKELVQTPLLDAEKDFLKRMLFDVPSGCTIEYKGWYSRLYYTREDGLLKEDLVVADVHTAPTDAAGGFVGWVVHAGTGRINLAVVVCDHGDGQPSAYIGPVMSYHERVTTNFKRLTDEEWQTEYQASPSYRPPLVNLYLADENGNVRGTNPQTLFLSDGNTPAAVDAQGRLLLPLGRVKQTALFQNFPNPFNPETWIPFNLADDAKISLAIYDAQGRQIRTLDLGHQRAGTYVTHDRAIYWDGRNENGELMPSGIYFYQIQVSGDSESDFTDTRKMVIVK